MTDPAWTRLGELLVSRRVDLGYPRRLTWARDVLGLSNDRIQSDLENGRRTNYDAGTLAQVEQQYRWAPGSIRKVLDGGEPTPIEDITPRQPDEPSEVAHVISVRSLDDDTLRWRLQALNRQLLEVEDEMAVLDTRLVSARDRRFRLLAQLEEVHVALNEVEGVDQRLLELTQHQRDILAVIAEHSAEYGYPPSMRVIGDHVGITNIESVAEELRTLERSGHIAAIREERRPLDELLHALAAATAAARAEVDNMVAMTRDQHQRLDAAAREIGKPSSGQTKRSAQDRAGTESQERAGAEEGA